MLRDIGIVVTIAVGLLVVFCLVAEPAEARRKWVSFSFDTGTNVPGGCSAPFHTLTSNQVIGSNCDDGEAIQATVYTPPGFVRTLLEMTVSRIVAPLSNFTESCEATLWYSVSGTQREAPGVARMFRTSIQPPAGYQRSIKFNGGAGTQVAAGEWYTIRFTTSGGFTCATTGDVIITILEDVTAGVAETGQPGEAVILLGDSVSDGINSEVGGLNALHTEMSNYFGPGYQVTQRACSGTTADGWGVTREVTICILQNFGTDNIFEGLVQPQLADGNTTVIVTLGIVGAEANITADNWEESMREIITQVHAACAACFVQLNTGYPVSGHDPTEAALLTEYRNRVITIAGDTALVEFGADLFNEVDHTIHTDDGTHPNDIGQTLIARLTVEAFRANLATR